LTIKRFGGKGKKADGGDSGKSHSGLSKEGGLLEKNFFCFFFLFY